MLNDDDIAGEAHSIVIIALEIIGALHGYMILFQQISSENLPVICKLNTL